MTNENWNPSDSEEKYQNNHETNKQIKDVILAFSSVNIMCKGLIVRKVERDSAKYLCFLR